MVCTLYIDTMPSHNTMKYKRSSGHHYTTIKSQIFGHMITLNYSIELVTMCQYSTHCEISTCFMLLVPLGLVISFSCVVGQNPPLFCDWCISCDCDWLLSKMHPALPRTGWHHEYKLEKEMKQFICVYTNDSFNRVKGCYWSILTISIDSYLVSIVLKAKGI